MRVIFLAAAAELIAEVVVVFVAWGSLLGVNALSTGLRVFAQGTQGSGRHTSRAAVADEIALVEQFDQGVLAMACDGAGVAHCSGVVIVIRARGGWIASQAGEKVLA